MALDKMKLQAFAKKQSAPPSGLSLLAKKKKPPAPAIDGVIDAEESMPPAAPVPGAADAPPEETGGEMFTSEMVEKAAADAAASSDQELEDALGVSGTPVDATPPAWATDADKWAQAAEAVGLGVPDAAMAYDEPGVVAAYLYKQMGGAVQGQDMVPPVAGAEGSPEEEAAETPEHEASEAPPQEAAEHAMGASPDGGDGDQGSIESLVAEAAKGGELSPEMQDKLTAYDPAVDGDPPNWILDEDADKWAQAKAAVEASGWDQYDAPYSVVAAVYEKLGGGVK
jgi:hypothetical protein